MNLKNLIKQNIGSIPGSRTKKKLVVIESDDWGSQRIPNLLVRDKLMSQNLISDNNRFNLVDSLEKYSDLDALYDMIQKHRDLNGNTPIITANFLTDNPDFDKIQESNFSQYYSESITATYQKHDPLNHTFNMILEGTDAGFLKPQFHGKEHLNVFQWMKLLQNPSSVTRKSFEFGVYCLDDYLTNHKRKNLMAAFDFDTDDEKDNGENIFVKGIENFEQLFQFKSLSFIAPCYVWHHSLENIADNYGIKLIQGIYNQFEPQLLNPKYKLKLHYIGQENKIKQKYIVRNCFMEVFENESFDHVGECLKRMEIAFRWGKPAIIGMHRANFVGSLYENNRNNSLKKLNELFTKMLQKWPDIEFVSTDQLLKYI